MKQLKYIYFNTKLNKKKADELKLINIKFNNKRIN